MLLLLSSLSCVGLGCVSGSWLSKVSCFFVGAWECDDMWEQLVAINAQAGGPIVARRVALQEFVVIAR